GPPSLVETPAPCSGSSRERGGRPAAGRRRGPRPFRRTTTGGRSQAAARAQGAGDAKPPAAGGLRAVERDRIPRHEGGRHLRPGPRGGVARYRSPPPSARPPGSRGQGGRGGGPPPLGGGGERGRARGGGGGGGSEGSEADDQNDGVADRHGEHDRVRQRGPQRS